MEQFQKNIIQSISSSKPGSTEVGEKIKAPHLSSNPMNGSSKDKHFEAEIGKAFFRVFFHINL